MSLSQTGSRRTALWAGVVLLALTGILYIATLDTALLTRELDGGDLITHQYAQVQARPGNAPGYPLYTMGGWLWFHTIHPLARAIERATPNPTPILSSYSTLWALISLALLYWILCFLTSSRYRGEDSRPRSGNWIIAWLVAAFYAVTYFFWYYATTTEQYSSAVAQTLGIVALWLLWQEADAAHGPELYGVKSRPTLLLIALAFLCGVSLAHMLTVAFIVPPLVVAVIWQRPGLLRSPALIVAVVVAAFLPLLSYAFIYVRAAQHPEWRGRGEWKTTWDWLIYFLSTPQGRDELREAFRHVDDFFANGFPALIWQELSAALLVIGLVGIALLRRKTAWLLYATLAIYLVFAWAYRYANWYQVVIPAYPLVLIGVAAAADSYQHWPRIARSPLLRALAPLILALAIAWRFAASLPEADSRHRSDDVDLTPAAVLLESAAPGAALFANVNQTLALDYLIGIWGLRPDVTTTSVDLAPGIVRERRPLLTTWEASTTLFREMQPISPLVVDAQSPDWARVDDQPIAAPDLRPLALDLLPGVRLTGVATAPAPTGEPVSQAAPAMDVWLQWEVADGLWPDGVSVSLRPTLGGETIRLDGSESNDFVHVDASQPLRGVLGDHPGARFVDAFRLPLAEALPAGADGIELILYRATGEGFETLADERIDLREGP